MGSSQPADSTGHREMAATIEGQRQQLFKASAVIDTCRYACASKFEGFDPEQLFDALHVVHDLIDGVAGALEQFAGDEATRRRRAEVADAQVVVQSLRTDAAQLLQQHPHLPVLHAQLVRAAAVIERLADLLTRTARD